MIGILGGSFDPPHNGHSQMLNQIFTKYNLISKLIIAPCETRSQKEHEALFLQRIEMTKLWVADYQRSATRLCPIQIWEGKYRYVYDLVVSLKVLHMNTPFCFFIGSDLISETFTWHNFLALNRIMKFVAIPRVGDISSTSIRKKIKDNDYDIPVCENVKEYILRTRLYSRKENS